jgi:hypothetical protein
VRQLDVFRNPSERSRKVVPYFVALQSHLFASRLVVVAPLLRQDGRSAFTLTSVPVRFSDADYIVMAGEMTNIDGSYVRGAVGNLRDYEDEICRAIERVFTGF